MTVTTKLQAFINIFTMNAHGFIKHHDVKNHLLADGLKEFKNITFPLILLETKEGLIINPEGVAIDYDKKSFVIQGTKPITLDFNPVHDFGDKRYFTCSTLQELLMHVIQNK